MRPTPNWLEGILQHLENISGEGEATVAYLRARRTKIGFRRLNPAAGAIWFPGNRIYFNSRRYSTDTPVDHPRLLCLLVHEAQHLQQGPLTALSIYGELQAWQIDFRLYSRLNEKPVHPAIRELLALPLNGERAVLKRAQMLMQVYAGKGYRSDLLPLYPLGREIRYRLFLH